MKATLATAHARMHALNSTRAPNAQLQIGVFGSAAASSSAVCQNRRMSLDRVGRKARPRAHVAGARSTSSCSTNRGRAAKKSKQSRRQRFAFSLPVCAHAKICQQPAALNSATSRRIILGMPRHARGNGATIGASSSVESLESGSYTYRFVRPRIRNTTLAW